MKNKYFLGMGRGRGAWGGVSNFFCSDKESKSANLIFFQGGGGWGQCVRGGGGCK